MKRKLALVLGNSNADYSLDEGAFASFHERVLVVSNRRERQFNIALPKTPQRGEKITINKITVERILASGAFSKSKPGGCGFHFAAKLRQFSSSQGVDLQIIFADSSAPSPVVRDWCSDLDVEYVPLSQHSAQRNFVVQGEDKIILREAIALTDTNDMPDLLSPISKRADIVALVAPKSVELCKPFADREIDLAMITPSVPPSAIELIGTAKIVIGNLCELSDAGFRLGLNVESRDENAPDAVAAAVKLLCSLRGKNCAGVESVCTLGKHGAVLSLQQRDRSVHLRPLFPAVQTRSGTGDATAAALLLQRITQPHRCPAMRTAVALANIAEWVGAPHDDIELCWL